MGRLLYIGKVALLFIGGAILLYLSSCSSQPAKTNSSQNIVTERSEDMKIIMSRNGKPSYRFETSLIEGYTLANEPYREFREGVKITTYKDDSLSVVDAILTSKYAIFYEESQLWEARGDVVAVKSDGRELYTQQLFWDSRRKLIYSNVDTKIIDTNNDDTFQGEGFESDEAMEKWSFRRLNGRMKVDVTPTTSEEEDSEEDEEASDSTKHVDNE
ncbi:MAG: LPS export ABC transporter periplasmic protein LptC [Rikenellaceae bacterium]